LRPEVSGGAYSDTELAVHVPFFVKGTKKVKKGKHKNKEKNEIISTAP